MPGMGGPMNRGGAAMPGMGGGADAGGGQAGQMLGAMFNQQGPKRPDYGMGEAPEWTGLMWQMQSRCAGGDGKACQQLKAMQQGLQQRQQQYGQDYAYAQQQAQPRMMRQR